MIFLARNSFNVSQNQQIIHAPKEELRSDADVDDVVFTTMVELISFGFV